MRTRNILFACVGAFAAASVGWACGPFFPWQLLGNRTETLTVTPNNTFAFEVAHLVAAPADQLRAYELAFNQSDYELERYRIKEEAEGLSDAQADLVANMRHWDDAASAMAHGADLPTAVRLYTVGAIAYRSHDYRQAAERFTAVLALPPADRAIRATWAAYMLGRSHVMLGDNAEAKKAFAQTRELAQTGSPDPLGLAVASYGEEARLHLEKAHDLPFDAEYRTEIATAVALYAQQAARGSLIAVESERTIAEGLLGLDTPPTDDAALPAVILDPMTQRMLVAYALARIEEGTPGGAQPPVLERLVAAIEATGAASPPGADRLAALCYRIGRYDLAETMAARAEGPLAAWVKAKLALHRGDLNAAAIHYAEASRAFPNAQDAPLDQGNRVLLRGEEGVLTLARGDYVGALEQLYPLSINYWGDVQHIADRVLTVDELKRFVDAHVPETPPQPPPKERPDSEWWIDPSAQLRALLARRLVREDRYDEALPYFPPTMRDIAHDYVTALHQAGSRWWTVDRAKAWYDASVLAREYGLELMGSEGAPDYLLTGGNLHCCVGPGEMTGPYVTDGEKDRIAASAMRPDKSYHYRFVAADLASKAADLLPPRSQAFAAVMCKATGYVMDKDRDAERVLYARYLRQGAHIAWAAHFGRDCHEPDFAAAARFPREQALRDARHFTSRYRWPFGGGIVVLIAACAWWFRRAMWAERQSN